MVSIWRVIVVAAGLSILALAGFAFREHRALRDVRQKLEAREALLPDQAAVMTIEAFQFTNLWFAVEAQNWPMAQFFLNEARKDLRWAVRVRPVRRNAQGRDIDIAAIAESVDNTLLAALKDAIVAKDRARAETAYKQALTGCQACHQASDRGFLRPRIPTAPAATIMSFDSSASPTLE
jgi:hypothetical protein